MLTTAQIDHFRALRCVALPGLLGQHAEALRHEVDAALRDAYAATYDERVIDGISGHYLPMACVCTPVSASLVCDDPVLIDAAEQLLGTPVLPLVPEGVLYFAEAGWHNDDGIGVRGVKLATYFESLDAAHGALRFVPCSHHLDAQRSLCAYQRAWYQDYPCVTIETSHGDVIAFDLHTFHASFGGRDRLAWAIEYLAEPGDGDERGKSLR
jgi:Phytanoyl-CoA dioxygenase (PhyH)